MNINIYTHTKDLEENGNEIPFNYWMKDPERLWNQNYLNQKLNIPLFINPDDLDFKIAFAQDGYFMLLKDFRAIKSELDCLKVWQKPIHSFTINRCRIFYKNKPLNSYANFRIGTYTNFNVYAILPYNRAATEADVKYFMQTFIYEPIKDISTSHPAYKNTMPYLPTNQRFSFEKFWDQCLSSKVTSPCTRLHIRKFASALDKEHPILRPLIYLEWPGAKMVKKLLNFC